MKVCLVTGASSGIGLATALELLRAGHTVYGAARRVHKMDAIRAAGGHVVAMDARDDEDLDRAVATVLGEQGRIDVLVNNAGTVLHGAIEDVPMERARDQLEVNLIAPARLAQLEAYSDTLRMEVEPFGIDVVIIQPGIIKTAKRSSAVPCAATKASKPARSAVLGTRSPFPLVVHIPHTGHATGSV
jgi:NAD(P)-dependent dehydrogenase (short-subunit alcohol dehydrogenase family)